MNDKINTDLDVFISIFGSCVSRDILNSKNAKSMKLDTYIARQSVISDVSPAIDCNCDDFDLKSAFQRKMIYNDFAKKVLIYLNKIKVNI